MSQSLSLVFLSNSLVFHSIKTFSNFFFDSFTCPPHAVRREQNLASKNPVRCGHCRFLRRPWLRVLFPFLRFSTLTFNPLNPMKTTHFTSGDYLTIRSETGQYSLRVDGDSIQAVKDSIHEMDAEIQRLMRRRAVYSQFVKGKSVQCPSALRL